jgi:hypothetical protein
MMEYDELKEHRVLLEEMLCETDARYYRLLHEANAPEHQNHPNVIRHYQSLADAEMKRMNALKAAVELADAELLLILDKKYRKQQ